LWLAVFAGLWWYVRPSDFFATVGLLLIALPASVISVLAFLLLFFILAEMARLYSWLAAMEPRLGIVKLAVLAVGMMFDLLAT
jgi:hypothetical protein